MFSALTLGLGGHLTVISIRRTDVGQRSCRRSASSQNTGLCSEPLVSPSIRLTHCWYAKSGFMQSGLQASSMAAFGSVSSSAILRKRCPMVTENARGANLLAIERKRDAGSMQDQ